LKRFEEAYTTINYPPIFPIGDNDSKDLFLAKCLYKLSKYNESISIFKSLENTISKNSEIHYFIGLTLQKLKNPFDAEKYLSMAVQ
jgi:hypothetical protein